MSVVAATDAMFESLVKAEQTTKQTLGASNDTIRADGRREEPLNKCVCPNTLTLLETCGTHPEF